MIKQLGILVIGFGLVACGEAETATPSAESNNWYDTDGSGGPDEAGTDTGTNDQSEDAADKPEDENAEVKPDEAQTSGLSWSGNIDLSTATGTVELTYMDEELNECTASATVSVEDYSETTCEDCMFQAGLRFDDIPVTDETVAGCSTLVEMRDTRIDVAQGATLVVEYGGVSYYSLLQMNDDGTFVEIDQGYSALIDDDQWSLGTK